MHAAKGLEFRAMAVIGCDDGLLPQPKAVAADDAAGRLDALERELLYCSVSLGLAGCPHSCAGRVKPRRGEAMAKRYRVTAEERGGLERMIARGKADARKLAHARVLLQADEADGGPGRVDGTIAAAVRVSVRTVERVRQRFVGQGLAGAPL